MVMCHIQGNAILVDLMKNKTEQSLIETYQKFIKRLNDAVTYPEKHILENECSTKYK